MAVIPRHKLLDEKYVIGYAWDSWKMDGFDTLRYPPRYLLQIMVKYYQTEMLHIMKENNIIWEINTDDVLFMSFGN